MRSSLLRSTPFRLVLVLGFVFILTLGLSALVAVRLIHQNLMERIDRDLVDTAAVLEQNYDSTDAPDLIDLVQSHVRATVDENEVYLLMTGDGQVLAGNLSRALTADGFATTTATELGLARREGRYRLLQRQLGVYTLVVGSSLAESDEVGFLVLTVLGWTFAIFAAVMLLLGSVFAIRGQRRLDVIAGTMEHISRGALTERIPLSGRGDDVDMLVSRVNGALDRLASLVEGMRQVSADIAHELRTPLNRLSIALTGAAEHAVTDPEMSALLEEAQAENQRVITIFDAMLRIAQIESGARKARFTLVPLTPLLASLAEDYAPVATDSGQTLTFRAGDVGTVLGDRDLLAQALSNLIENAIRHCPNGASILLEGRRDGDRALIIVADNGPGIPDVDKPHVFDRLYRVEKSRTTPGNGLGLALVKAVAELHGATVELTDNHPGIVMTIRIRLHKEA